jgi:glutaredoxin
MIIVYGKNLCGSCEMVKTSLTRNGIAFEYESLDDMDFEAADSIVKLATEAGIRTLPVIMMDGNVVTLKDALATEE